MKETLENRKRRTKTKVRKRNDCLNKEKKITQRERERGGGENGTLLCTFNFSRSRKWWGRTILCRERK